MAKKPASNWHVYIVKCADSSFYTGVTTDIERRVKEHNANKVKAARYTRARQPVNLVYAEQCDDRSSACKREYAIKQFSRKAKLQLIENHTP